MALIRRSQKPRRGIAAVELALVIPFVLALLLGVWEVGRLININQILSNAAREGARKSVTGQVSTAQVQQTVINYLNNAGLPTANAVVTVSDLTSPGTDPSNASQLDQIQVSVTMPFADVRWVALYLVTNSTTQLSGQAVWCCIKDQAYPTTLTSPPGF